MNRLLYPCRPVGSISALARALSCSSDELLATAQSANTLYHPKQLEKENGGYREVYRVDEPLKSLQDRIVRCFFNRIEYPIYLQGAIRDRSSPRSDICDASLHASQSLIVKLDIDSFFPSIKAPIILATWKHFFRFPTEVADLLTHLTTYSDSLPQGAPTSNGLANLVFWDAEPQVAAQLRDLGFRYSRYVDDVTVSIDHHVNMKRLEPVFRCVFGMFASKGVKPKRNKIEIQTSGDALEVHGHNVNGLKPTMPSATGAKIRSAVFECEQRAVTSRYTVDYRRFWRSVQSRVQRMRSLNAESAEPYLITLASIGPCLSSEEFAAVRALVTDCRVAFQTNASKGEYKRQYEDALRSVQELCQFFPGEMQSLLRDLRAIRPADIG